jgi:hypothetical protein
MAVVNGYVTTRGLARELGINDEEDDLRLEVAITTASRQIDAHCGRRFWQDPVSPLPVRTYQATDQYVLDVDDISTETGLVVKIDQDLDGTFETTLTKGTHFLLAPLNALVDVPAMPYEQLVLVDTYTWPAGRRPGVQVTARFGFPAIPSDVVTACTIQAKNLYKVTGAGIFGSMQLSVDGIPMRIPGLDYVARTLLEPFRKTVVG